VHEASIVEELMATALRHAAGRRILDVQVRVGLLTGVSPDAMQFYFEAVREESLGAQAILSVVMAPLCARCTACQERFELAEVAWSCPRCGEAALEFDNGSELDLLSLTLDDDPADHPRAEDPQEER
jgi:hydrogenase nickel incorporation protein HypA/HybF